MNLFAYNLLDSAVRMTEDGTIHRGDESPFHLVISFNDPSMGLPEVIQVFFQFWLPYFSTFLKRRVCVFVHAILPQYPGNTHRAFLRSRLLYDLSVAAVRMTEE